MVIYAGCNKSGYFVDKLGLQWVLKRRLKYKELVYLQEQRRTVGCVKTVVTAV